ncbi:MAG: excinuclease ABC subunit UvrA [Candidatus Ancaeobacter aquaticus]|nr:excinuclease ABC subunit UvrA [Candidatus Ancaeobacter aquaticus]
MPIENIFIKGAREHNLKNIDLTIPRDKLVVITGLSGSGKSSLAFDTLFAEGQRRYVESLSAYARQFLAQMQKPEVDYIEGLSPAISIEQRTAGSNPRSTVGTTTEIYDYMRLLFARVGIPHCPKCGKKINKQSSQQIVDSIMALPQGTRLDILAPMIRGRKGEHQHVFDYIRKEGFVKVRVDSHVYDINEEIKLNKNVKHTIEAVVDRVVIKPEVRSRLTDSIEIGLKLGEGLLVLDVKNTKKEERYLSELNSCTDCGVSFSELTPRMFSFNSPYGACQACHGLGTRMNIDVDLIVPNKELSLENGAIYPWQYVDKPFLYYNRRLLKGLSEYYSFDLLMPWKDISDEVKDIVLYGSKGQKISVQFWHGGYPQYRDIEFEGVIPNLERRFHETDSSYIKKQFMDYMNETVCPDCKGSRLKAESLAVTIKEKSIVELCALAVEDLKVFFEKIKLSAQEKTIAHEVIKEITERLGFMTNVGIGYLTLDRQSGTLSGGEAQRIRLATQIGSGLVGVLYILDEPSIGLHQRDNEKLLATLKRMRDLGNTVLVVEHDEATMRDADHIIDLGPGAGAAGGHIVAQGSLQDILKSKESFTGKYLRGDLEIALPKKRRKIHADKQLVVKNARENNLKNVDVSIPLGVFVAVTGVSGSGKSTLVDDVLRKGLEKKLNRSRVKPGKHDGIKGIEHVDKVAVIDQTPIGRTPRSNPATYTGAFTHIRDLFSRLPESKMRGYGVGRYSFNVKGGRCEACKGDGIIKIEMHFLPDVYVECEVCKGQRYNSETLQVKYRGKNINEILSCTVDEGLQIFKNIPAIKDKLKTMSDVGLGYIKLGQSATTLSGGEAQRVKLSSELSKKATGKTIYILDEPTTGLHFADVQKLLDVLHRLTDMGNTAIVIEHNLDVIKTSDYIIDLGPEGGARGGNIVAAGRPEDIMKVKKSYTGIYLKEFLKKR